VGLSSTATNDGPTTRRRSIRSAFIAAVAVPTAILLLIWAGGAGFMVASVLIGHNYLAEHRAMCVIVLAALGVLVIVAVVLLTAAFARRMTRDVRSLATTAWNLTDQRGRPRGAQPPPAPPQAHRPTAEIAQAERAIISLKHTAAKAADSEVSLRNGLREVFVSMARRNQSLLQRQLRLIDQLEQKASDPAALADLFSLDHLTTRMRRHAESLAILSGAAPGRAWRDPVPVIDVIRGAMAEVEDYKRVTVLTRSEDSLSGPAVADMIHLLAELIENATLFSPSGTRVEVRAGRVANGFAVEIDDRGLGVEPAQLTEINRQLAEPPDFDLANSDRLGLFVGGKLAARHGVRVSLRASPFGGTTAIVLMPGSIVVPGGTPVLLESQRAPADGQQDGLELGGGEALALAGRHPHPHDDQPHDEQPSAPRQVRIPGASGARASGTRSSGIRTPGARASGAHASGTQAAGLRGSGAQPAGAHATSARVTGVAPPELPGRTVTGLDPAPTDTTPPADTTAPAGTTGPGDVLPGEAFTRPALPRRSGGRSSSGEPPTEPEDESYHGLPRRTRQASLSPHLRDRSVPSREADSASGPGSGLPPSEVPAPEHARNLAASLQNGWQRGRAGDPLTQPQGSTTEPANPGPAKTAQPPAADEPTARDLNADGSQSEDG
jgi:signal transduction histidine kinase